MTLREWVNASGVDEGALNEYTMHNEALAMTVIKMFPGDKAFDRLTLAMGTRDTAGVRAAAHALKGVAACLGMNTLRALASEMVEAADDGESARFEDLFARVQTEYKRLLALVSQLSDEK